MTAKGAATRAAILEAAHSVFRKSGYYGSSVSRITRRCCVSMGTFYQYFKNKEQVFLELYEFIISRFTEQAGALELLQPTFEARFKTVLELLYHHTRHNFAFHRILGESELIDRVTIDYYESIARYYREFLQQEMQAGNMPPMDANLLAYGFIGMCYFNSLQWGGTEEAYPPDRIIELILDLTLNGISGLRTWNRPADWHMLALPEPTRLQSTNDEPITKGERTRKAIFRAAETVFGRHGISRANIGEITRAAGVAQGTFYVHFESKADLVEGFVKYINHEMRREIQRFAGRMDDRRDMERVGILTFLRFIREHRQVYRVVPECEMISRNVALWYYNKMAQGYVKGLATGMQKGEIRDLPPVLVARSLIGLIHFIGLRWIIWNTNPSAGISAETAGELISFVLFGLKGETTP